MQCFCDDEDDYKQQIMAHIRDRNMHSERAESIYVYVKQSLARNETEEIGLHMRRRWWWSAGAEAEKKTIETK